ncbi:hypothetical protein [Nocardia goodfellowii]|uniref:Uncharacterized protein n=1 Tax=Nocardia goodfellowii TaxID=882446 RepID=A0ABS4QHZ6_9NOCA|nr:hypothetical protein [Nocardia goodfellowii]MBP2190689.1 hypothetical protein [Nocardia goodfellowii]
MMQIGSSAFWLTLTAIVVVPLICGIVCGFAASNGGASAWQSVETGFSKFASAMGLAILLAGFIVALGAANAAFDAANKDEKKLECRSVAVWGLQVEHDRAAGHLKARRLLLHPEVLGGEVGGEASLFGQHVLVIGAVGTDHHASYLWTMAT